MAPPVPLREDESPSLQVLGASSLAPWTGGVGKSHIIKLVHYETMKLLKPLSGYFEPDDIPVILTTFTGTAAFGIEGMTLHSAMSFTAGPRSKKSTSH